MEFKGTKGKWLLETSDNDLLIVYSDVNEIGNVICEKPEVNTCKESLKNWPANALLISKAPEMLEFIQSISACENTPVAYRKIAKKLIKEATEI